MCTRKPVCIIIFSDAPASCVLLCMIRVNQTGRIWDYQSGETKAELRGHENVVETIVFAPISAYAAIRELGGISVSEKQLFQSHLYSSRFLSLLIPTFDDDQQIFLCV